MYWKQNRKNYESMNIAKSHMVKHFESRFAINESKLLDSCRKYAVAD